MSQNSSLSKSFKEIPGAENPIPLSPQWLLPKPGEYKTGISARENRPNPFTGYGDVSKSPPGNGEESDKKKDVLRADAESGAGRRDLWRDEERDTVTLTKPSARRERWREGDKTDSRWGVDNSSSRRWAADPTREINNNNSNYDQRRENKWNTRWGPDDKEVDDKWSASGRHFDMPPEKISHGKDEKEGDHYRPWRPSSLLGRAKPEPPHHQNRFTPKEAPTFGHGRGRAESASSFSVGGRANYGSGSVNYSIHSYTSGLNSDRGGDNGHGEASPFRYSRTQLLDIYRLTDVTASNQILDGLMQVPSLTQEEPLEPLALSVLTPEESVIFKGIDKGEVVSSGAAQISKDGFTGRSSNDFPQTRRIKDGSKDDASFPPDDDNDKVDHEAKGTLSKISEGFHHEKQMHAYGSDVTIDKNENHVIYGDNKIRLPDSGTQGRLYAQSASPWRSSAVEQLASIQSCDWHDTPNDIRSRSSDIPWSQAPKDNSIEWGNVLPDPLYAHNELKRKVGEGSAVRKHPAVVDREQESKKLLQPSPEDLLLYYKDPRGQIQGPFTGSDIIGWFEAGYFGIDLLVRLVNATNDSPFSLLGDVMPHLWAKVRPPPGFSSAKQTEVPDVSSRSTLTGFRKVLPGPSGIPLLGNEHRHTYESSTEAENRFIESLMSADVSGSLKRFAVSEGPQGFVAQTSNSMPPLGTESGEALNLLAQRMNLERQKSFTHPYSYWSTRDGAPVVPVPDIARNSNVPPANLLPTVGDMSRQSLSQTAEMMSILQGLSDRSSGGMNNGLGGWPNFSMQGGIDPFKDNKIELHHGQNFPQVAYGMQQHKLQPQNSPPLTNLLSQQILENPSMLPDKILSSGLTQDPQMLNLLQQQFLLQQLQSQQSAAGPQLSLLDKILLIKQQQKQEEQQELLRQQQKLLSQVLSEQQLAQRFGDPTLGQLQASAPLVGNSAIDQSVSQPSPSMFQMNSQTSVSGMPDDRIASMPPQVPQDFCHTVPTESTYLQLPHQMLGNLQQNCPSMSDHNLSSSEMMENLATSEALERHQSAASMENSTCEFSAPSSVGQVMPTSVVDSGQSVLSSDSVLLELSESFDCKSSVNPQDNEILNFERDNDAKLIPTGALEETSVKECREALAANEANNAEAREVKKISDKKSRKMKSSKAQPSPKQVKGASKGSPQKFKQCEAEGALVAHKSEVSVTTEATIDWTPMEAAKEISCPPENDISISSTLQSDVITQQSVPVNSAQRAWKPAASVKPKSLLEIQQEEQKAQMEIPASSISASVSPFSSSTPWAGVLTHVEPKVSRETHQDSAISEHKTESSKSKKSGLHDLLAAEVLAKSSDRSIEVDNSSSLSPLPTVSNQRDVVDENFIEAKDTKKSRKKAAKAKVAGAKVSADVSSTDAMIAFSPVEKGKSSKHVQAVKEEVLPAPPSGPSLGDFVCWKGESTSPSPAPAWSTDSEKFPKPTSLRDILKEQENKVTPAQQHFSIPTPQKSQFSQARTGSWSVSASSPSKAASPVQIHSQLSSQSKSKGDNDLFWGPPDQSKQDTKQLVFPQLRNQGNWATKSTPIKATAGASINRQKSTVGRAVENYALSPSDSAQVAVKGRRDGSTKHLEAMDFRDWCESESVRLTGSKDTSFLVFCSKQSRSEAQTLLVENLSSFDPNHEFIDKFLNYLELLSADVLELAFQSRNDLKVAYNNGGRDMNSDNLGFGDFDSVASSDGSIKVGKKKGKKGKKVSSSVLGFNVVSNRIMMGEIQSVED